MAYQGFVVSFVLAWSVIVQAEEPFALPIIGGETSSVSEFPFLVSLARADGSRWNSFCGGTIINESFVLTAAHCKSANNKGALVVAGVHNLDTDYNQYSIRYEYGTWFRANPWVQVRNITAVIPHPKYNPSVPALYDIGLVKLSEPLSLTEGQVEGARLSTTQKVSLLTKKAKKPCRDPEPKYTVTGWGRTSREPGSASNVPKKLELSIVSKEDCQKKLASVRSIRVTEGSICAASPTRNATAFKGDSGGPLVRSCGGNKTVIGIVSCGDPQGGCELQTQTTVFTSVAFFHDWITTGKVESIPDEGRAGAGGKPPGRGVKPPSPGGKPPGAAGKRRGTGASAQRQVSNDGATGGMKAEFAVLIFGFLISSYLSA